MFWIKEKFVSLHRKTEMKCSIGLWCNGNTTDSGPVIPGSNPGSPTEKRTLQLMERLFYCPFLVPSGINALCPKGGAGIRI